MRTSVVTAPSCNGIDDISSWIDHEYFKNISEQDLVPFSALIVKSDDRKRQQKHRCKRDDKIVHRGTFDCEESLYQAMSLVATPLRPKEWKSISKAKESVQSECDSLRKIKCWNEKGVREWADVKREANKAGKSVAKGSVFPICVVKHSESAVLKKYKGRVCFQGTML